MYRGPCDSLHVSIDSRMDKKRSRMRREALCPPIGALLRYRTRIVRVVAEARGQRAMIESLDTAGRTFVSTVKWVSLCELGNQLF
ncbi:hypothetical protein R69927_05833 [Paraburkholderia domus]|nr:hypothetical protein R69927_05833 [Paraburkholderia domus]